MRVALDTNILVYAAGVNGMPMKERALDLTGQLPPETAMLAAQTLGEFFNVLVRKAKWPPATARVATLKWADSFPLIETSPPILLSAVDLAVEHQLRIWDAVLLSAAAEAKCRLVLSEDLQDGFTWRGVTVTNPFTAPRHPLLTALLDGRDK